MLNLKIIRSLNNLEIAQATLTDYQVKEHFHDTFSIALVLKGAGRFKAKSHLIETSRGGISIIPPYEVHTGQSHPRDGLNYQTLAPATALLERYIDGFQSNRLILKDYVIYVPRIAHLYKSLHQRLMQSKAPLEQEECFTQLMEILYFQNPLPSNRPNSKERKFSKQRLAPAIEFMHEAYDQKISLLELANLVSLSSSQLLRTFKGNLGISPFSYLINIRLNKAKELLIRGESISDVAQSTGFYDQSHLTKYFKNVYCLTPKQYQLALKK